MSESSATKKNVSYGAIAIGILILSLVIYKVRTAGSGLPPPPPSYYSADGGKTWFALSEFKCPPFAQDNREVDSANLFVGADGKPFVGFLFKYNAEGQGIFAGFKGDSMTARQAAAQFALVKRPGDKEWVSAGSARGREIVEKVLDPKTHQPAQPYDDPS